MRLTYLTLLSAALVCCREKENSVEKLKVSSMLFEPSAVAMADEMAPMTTAPVADRKLIRKGRIEFQTHDVVLTKIELSKICGSLHAYMSDETQRDSREAMTYSDDTCAG